MRMVRHDRQHSRRGPVTGGRRHPRRSRPGRRREHVDQGRDQAHPARAPADAFYDKGIDGSPDVFDEGSRNATPTAPAVGRMHTFPTAPGRRSLRTIGISPGRRGADDRIRCRKRACDRAPQMLLVLVRWARCRRRLNTHPRVPVGNAPLGQPACWVVRVGVEPGLFGVALVRGRLVVGVERSAEIRRMHVPMRLKSGSGEGRRPARAVGLLSINLTLLAELALLLESTRMNGAGNGKLASPSTSVLPSKTIIAVAVAERSLRFEPGPLTVVMIGPVPVQRASTETVCNTPRLSRTSANVPLTLTFLRFAVELRRRRPYEAPAEGAVRTQAHEADPERRIGVRRRPRLDEVVRLHDQAAIGGRGAIRALERDQPAGGGNFLREAVRGRCDGRYDKQRQGGEQGDDVPVRPGRSVGGSASRQLQTTHERPPCGDGAV